MNEILSFIGFASLIVIVASLAIIANFMEEIIEFFHARKVNMYTYEESKRISEQNHEIERINLSIKQEQIQAERIRLELELADKKIKLQK